MPSPLGKILVPLSAPLSPDEFSEPGGTPRTSDARKFIVTSRITNQRKPSAGSDLSEHAAESIDKTQGRCEDPNTETHAGHKSMADEPKDGASMEQDGKKDDGKDQGDKAGEGKED